MRVKGRIFMAMIESNDRRGHARRALGCAKRWVTSEPNDSEAWYALAVSAGNVGARDEEIAAYLRCLSINPDHGYALVNVGASYCESNDFVAGEKALRRARIVHANDPLAYTNLAVCLAKQNKDEDAMAVFKDLVALGRLSARGYRNAAIARQVYEMVKQLSSFLDDSHKKDLAPYLLELGLAAEKSKWYLRFFR
jgi:Flp pilus assembly protein TadD